jgi:proteasome lid subunit RPN8/RPN11
MVRPIEGQLRTDLLRITTKRSPEEAVGLIRFNGEVVELLNVSRTPQETFEVHKSQIVAALENDEDALRATLWHSHPKGVVGPSRTDIRSKTPFAYHLVISLVDGDIVPTWY